MGVARSRKVEREVGYLECRSFGHAWDDITATAPRHKVTYLDGVRVTVRCPRCTTEREDVWSTETGKLLHRKYRYPVDYKYATEAHDYRYSKDELRVMYIEQAARNRRRRRRVAS